MLQPEGSSKVGSQGGFHAQSIGAHHPPRHERPPKMVEKIVTSSTKPVSRGRKLTAR